jgi:hypothetical protein
MSLLISSRRRLTLTNLSPNSQMVFNRSDPRQVSTNSAAPGAQRSMADRMGSVRGLTRRSFHRIAFTDWGSPTADRAVLCVHGITRNGRDFDHLAAALAGRGRRVVCPDLPGREQSDRLIDSSDYVLPQYCSDMTALMAALGSVEIDWVGTSLGGSASPNGSIHDVTGRCHEGRAMD